MYLALDSDDNFFKNIKEPTDRGQNRVFVDAQPVSIVPRETWGAAPARVETPLPGGVVKHVLYVYASHTRCCYSLDECSAQLRNLQQRCFDKDKDDIFYNFMIGGDGQVYEGRGWHLAPDKYLRLGDHMDPATIYVAYIGDFADINPNIKQWHAGWKLLEHGFRNKIISERDFFMYYCS
uniref:Peptidoglycan recognition protein 17 n=1 Tax=Nephotettix cincticeps TaxID=94400 RepID=A0A5H2WV08_NEPCI|nr:peptidoglycan recognition protein 17 [Nephotettix cincticeps]